MFDLMQAKDDQASTITRYFFNFSVNPLFTFPEPFPFSLQEVNESIPACLASEVDENVF